MLLRKCYDIYPCTRLALQVGTWLVPPCLAPSTLLPERWLRSAHTCLAASLQGELHPYRTQDAVVCQRACLKMSQAALPFSVGASVGRV